MHTCAFAMAYTITPLSHCRGSNSTAERLWRWGRKEEVEGGEEGPPATAGTAEVLGRRWEAPPAAPYI